MNAINVETSGPDASIGNPIARLTMPGRMTAVHCMDIPTGNTGRNRNAVIHSDCDANP